MRERSQDRNGYPTLKGLGRLLTVFGCAFTLAGCQDDGTPDDNTPTAALNQDTQGAMSISVSPAAALVEVTGPGGFEQSFTGSQLLSDLEPGNYAALVTASGYGDAVAAINVVPGFTSFIYISLVEGGGSTDELGSLNINITPASGTLAMTGPGGYDEVFTGNQFLSDLEAGQYAILASAAGYGDASGSINVVDGATSLITFFLEPTAIVAQAPRAVYKDGNGSLIPLDVDSFQAGQFVFHAWLDDEEGGINPSVLTTTLDGDPGSPTEDEQQESAPSFTQNLAAAWIGYIDPGGVMRPVIGADVRWEIDQWYAGRVNSMQFGSSDDNSIAQGYGIDDDQSDTRTNNASIAVEGFPLVSTEYPLFNQTGLGTPYVDGLTWVTLFSPDAFAEGRVVVVATIDGIEIGKHVLVKNFAPAPELQITKKVSKEVVNLVDGTATVTWTVTVENVGLGTATAVDLVDVLASGDAGSYTLTSRPVGSVSTTDGYTHTFPVTAQGTPGDTVVFTFNASVTEPGTYCNEAEIVSYTDGQTDWTPVDLNADACFTALESNVSIIKDFVAADDTTSLGKSRTVPVNTPAKLRVRVINNGTGAATGVVVHDELTTGPLASYDVNGVPGTANNKGGFDVTIGTIAAGATTTLLFTAEASVDGRYCDTATVTATSGTIGINEDTACLTVATPVLVITKVNSPDSVIPGTSYTSTITVRNTGNATAEEVVISDLLGYNPEGGLWVTYVSSSMDGFSGTVANHIVTAPTITIGAGQTATFTVVSRIPMGAISGTYCDTATVISSNAPTDSASACVDVPSFAALQTQLIDQGDPASAGDRVSFFTTLYVEARSNEGVVNNELLYSFGLKSPTVLGIPGEFVHRSTNAYFDPEPVVDPVTGLVVSDSSNPTARLLTPGTDYTMDNTTEGLQLLIFRSTMVFGPDVAVYLVHEVLVPADTKPNALYTSSYIWDCDGTGTPGGHFESSASEPTTVISQ